MQDKKITKIKCVLFPFIILILVFLDQFTKKLAVKNLKGQEDITFLKGVIDFSYLENTGAAWGMLSGKIIFFVILTAIMMFFLVFVIYRVEVSLAAKKKKIALLLQYDLVVLIAGAIGNLVDRVMNGYVVDFIATTFMDFPVFNVADCYVTVSVAILVITLIFGVKEDDLDEILKFNLKKNTKKEEE